MYFISFSFVCRYSYYELLCLLMPTISLLSGAIAFLALVAVSPFAVALFAVPVKIVAGYYS